MSTQVAAKDCERVQSAIPAIKQLYFYVTEGCNLACCHCWIAPRTSATGDRYSTLPVELFETAIREAKPFGLSAIKLTGGEPLLHPHFNTLMDIVRREELEMTIETNGLLCTPEIASQIAKSPRPSVSVSIDGVDATTHERVRGVRGSFQAAQKAVKALVASGIRPQIIFTVMSFNADQVDGIVRMAEGLGAASVKFNVVQPTSRGEILHNDGEALNVSSLINIGRHVEQELAPTTKIRLFFDYPPAFRSLRSIAGGEGCGICGIINIMGVIASGHYALCGIGRQVPDLVFGEVGKDPLEKVWLNHAVVKELRRGLPGRLEGICARCLMRRSCLGACVAQNYYRAGSLWAPYWFCEQADEAGLFPASRLQMTLESGKDMART